MNNFGSRLRQLRQERNLYQKHVAEALGLTSVAIVYYEGGKRSPSLEIFEQLCHFFDVSADYLLGLSDDPKRK